MKFKLITYRILLIVSISISFSFSFSKILLASGEKSASKKYELVIWHTLSSYNKNVLKSLIDDYSKSNPYVTIKTVFYSNDKDIIINLIKKDSLPDIILISTQYIDELVKNNLLINLSGFISKKEYLDIDKRFWKPVEIKNKIFGYPFMYDVFMLFVNQNSLWDIGLRDYKEPTSWKEIEKISSKIHYLDNRKWGLFIPIENIEELSIFVKSFTGEEIVKGNKIIINDKNTIKAMQFLQDLVYKQKIMPPKTTLNEAQSIFMSGKLAIMMSLSSNLVYITSNFPYNLDVWKMPIKRGGTFIKGNCLSIIKKNNTDKVKSAFDFIEFLGDKESSIKWFTHTGIPPLKKSIKDSLELLLFYENNPNYTIPMFELDQGKVFPKIDHYYDLNVIIKNAMEEIMINRENVTKSLNNAQKKINQLIHQ